ncbi:transcription termination factor NusA [candidate division TA06 bacterium]|nr:transcription termination factor NusA [candidate division TA06 bacterium]
MITFPISDLVTQIVSERGLAREFVIETLKESLLAGVKKRYGTTENVTVEIEENRGTIQIFRNRKVVEKVENPELEIDILKAREIKPQAEIGEEISDELSLEEFSRTAIILAKQILNQKVREAERERVYTDFSKRTGEVITGTIHQVDHRGVLVSLGKSEGLLPPREQIPSERYRQGSPLRALIFEVKKTTKGPQVILSRSHPDFLKRLFEFEVPEVHEGIVTLRAVAREPGDRAKIAVSSIDDKIDPVGACVGVKGSRVQTIVRELNNEKIDVIQYSSDQGVFLTRALSPAKVSKCIVEGEKASAVIPDDQLSLAIGKGGQNARLASRLTNLQIDIIRESEYKKREAEIPLLEVTGLTPRMVEILAKGGFQSAQDVEKSSEEDLLSIPGVGPKSLEKIKEEVRKAVHGET